MTVRFAVLGLLAQRPRHGYELHAACEHLAGGAQTWDIKPAQIYSTLSRLEQRGWVRRQALAKVSGPERHIYAVTAEGADGFQRWLASGLDPGHQHDAFFIKLGLALGLGRERSLEVIQTQRAHLCRSLHAVMLQRQHADPRRGLARTLLLDKVAMHLEADLRWLDQVEARLDEIERQPSPEPAPRPRGRPRKTKAARRAAGIGQGEGG